MACSVTVPVAMAQFDEAEGFSQDDGSPADRPSGFRGREERGDRGNREGGEGFRGRGGPRPNPMFEAIDADGDGMITPRELRTALKALKSLDADGDGNISLEEVTPQRGPGGPGGPGRGGDPSEMIDRFMERDANSDGKLTPDEVDQRMAFMLRDADTNGDGAVDRAELETAMQNMRGGPGFFGGGGGPGRGGNFGGPGGDPDSMTRQFMSADQNGDGIISKSELNPQMATMMQGADTNGDGALNAKEVRMFMETARQRMQQFRAQGGPAGRFDRDRQDRGGRNDDQQQ